MKTTTSKVEICRNRYRLAVFVGLFLSLVKTDGVCGQLASLLRISVSTRMCVCVCVCVCERERERERERVNIKMQSFHLLIYNSTRYTSCNCNKTIFLVKVEETDARAFWVFLGMFGHYFLFCILQICI